MSLKWKWFLPGYLLALPHTLVGVLITVLFYGARRWRWQDGALECLAGRTAKGKTRIWGRPAAQTHGFLVVYSSAAARKYVPLRRHERAHVVQSFVGGPLYVLMYGVFFAANLLYLRDWWLAYAANPFERQADARQSVEDAWGSRA